MMKQNFFNISKDYNSIINKKETEIKESIVFIKIKINFNSIYIAKCLINYSALFKGMSSRNKVEFG